MFTNKILPALLSLFVLAGMTGCTDVGVNPKSQAGAEKVFAQEGAYKSYLAKLYGGLNVTGQEGPAGNPDIKQIDEGFSQYVRLWWQMQELPTDEAVIAWNDGNVQELNTMTWSATNGFTSAMYSRIYFQVAHVNEFLRQSSQSKLDARDVGPEVRQKIPQWRAEARFLRALSYWHGIDLFGDIPLVKESFPRGGKAPPQATRKEVFNYVEKELLAITNAKGEENLLPAGQAQYGRVDKSAAWFLLAKLYQNAPVYIGKKRSSEVIKYTTKILDSGVYSLEPNYQDLFLADNHTANGLIFSIPMDGQKTQHYGGTTFLAHAAVGGSLSPDTVGLGAGWAGLRTTRPTVQRYSSGDQRPVFPNTPDKQFYRQGQSLAIQTLTDFTQGYAVPKYQNVTSTGEPGKNATFPDTDYPMFRLAEVHLMYAEAVLRGGGGSKSRAVSLINDLRERAFGDQSGNITKSELTLDFILDERSRELLWEATRRTDLIRFGKFTGGEYVWPWKGDVQGGTSTDEKFRLYPLPQSELLTNPNLEQNPGY
ncbi:MAG: RagB/SusD family nutrient uptake outer membrane protein [Salinibacter sp.]